MSFKKNKPHSNHNSLALASSMSSSSHRQNVIKPYKESQSSGINSKIQSPKFHLRLGANFICCEHIELKNICQLRCLKACIRSAGVFSNGDLSFMSGGGVGTTESYINSL